MGVGERRGRAGVVGEAGRGWWVRWVGGRQGMGESNRLGVGQWETRVGGAWGGGTGRWAGEGTVGETGDGVLGGGERWGRQGWRYSLWVGVGAV